MRYQKKGSVEKGSVGRAKRLLVPVLTVGAISAGVVGLTATPAFAVTSQGYACGYYSNVSLFGGPYGSEGCGTQTSSYAGTNSAAPSTSWSSGTPTTYVNDANGVKAQYGPADMLSSPWLAGDVTANTGALTVTTQGSTTIQATAQATGIGPSPLYTSTPTSADNPSSPAGYVFAKCTASGPSTYGGQVAVSKGWVDTSLDANGYPVTTVPVDSAPAQNSTISYTIDNISSGGVKEHGYIKFNERILNADGTYSVNGSHMVMQGPISFGDVIIAQTKCGHA